MPSNNLPALSPRLFSRGTSAMQPTAAQQTASLCERLRLVDEDGAWGLLQLVVHEAVNARMPADEICRQLKQLANCRQWPRKAKDLKQLLERHCSSSSSGQPNGNGMPNGKPGKPSCSDGCGGPGNCGCGPCKEAKPTMNPYTPQPGPSDWSSRCGGYRQPDPNDQGLIAANACSLAACQGGTRIGLEMIPFKRTFVPGTEQTITLGFTRPSRLVALSFTRRQLPTATASYNPDNFTIRKWKTSATIQAYDIPRQNTTFGGENLNEVDVSLINFFEDGANSFSPILHAMNALPRFIPPFDIGSNEGLVQFDILLDVAAPANETVFWWAWVLFTGQGN